MRARAARKPCGEIIPYRPSATSSFQRNTEGFTPAGLSRRSGREARIRSIAETVKRRGSENAGHVCCVEVVACGGFACRAHRKAALACAEPTDPPRSPVPAETSVAVRRRSAWPMLRAVSAERPTGPRVVAHSARCCSNGFRAYVPGQLARSSSTSRCCPHCAWAAACVSKLKASAPCPPARMTASHCPVPACRTVQR